MRGVVQLASAAMTCMLALSAWAQGVTSGSYRGESGGQAVQIQPAGDAVVLIDGDRFVTYERQGEGLYHAYDARTDTTHALRVVDANTIELYRAYSADAERLRLQRIRPDFVMEAPPPESVIPEADPGVNAFPAAASGADAAPVPEAATTAPPVQSPGSDTAVQAATLKAATPALNLSTELPQFPAAPSPDVSANTALEAGTDPEARLLQLACEAAAEARTLYDAERYAEYLGRLQLAVAPALHGRRSPPCSELSSAQIW